MYSSCLIQGLQNISEEKPTLSKDIAHQNRSSSEDPVHIRTFGVRPR